MSETPTLRLAEAEAVPATAPPMARNSIDGNLMGMEQHEAVLQSILDDVFTPVKESNTLLKPYPADDSDVTTEESSSPKQQRVVPTISHTFEKHYDLILLVGTSPVAEFKVCSRTLARKVEYFEKMLYGPYTERKPESKDWVVELPETDITSFELVLSLVHDDRSKIPGYPDEEILCKLVTTIDYFGMTFLFQSWIIDWHDTLKAHINRGGVSSALRSNLPWVAWNLGSISGFGSILKQVVLEMWREKNGPYRMKDGTLVSFGPELARFQFEDQVAYHHEALITKMSMPYNNTFATMTTSHDPQGPHRCKSRGSHSIMTREICDRVLLGSFVEELGEVIKGGSECFKAKKLFHLSVNECAGWLLGIQLKGLEGSSDDHKNCNPTKGLHRAVVDTMSSFQGVLTEELVDNLKNKQKKWGLYLPLW